VTPTELIEEYYRRGLTDGWPIYPPSEDRLKAMLAATCRPSEQVLGIVKERGRAVTVQKVAVNAMLAGCLPEYMPVVLAAVDAMLDPRFNLGSMMSTAGAAPMVIIHGPVATAIGAHSGVNLFHSTARANVTIGRTVALVIRNVLSGKAGIFDQSTLGHPGKYSYCIAEGDSGTWGPVHAESGSREDESAVTLFAAEAPFQVHNDFDVNAEGILRTIASGMCVGRLREGAFVIIVGPEHAATIQGQGWSRAKVRGWLASNAVRTRAEAKSQGWYPGPVEVGDDRVEVRAAASADDILVLCAGGPAGRFSAIVRSWGGTRESLAVRKAVYHGT
jgi:hypothetical protein